MRAMNKKVLFVTQSVGPFVQRDIEVLRLIADGVEMFHWTSGKILMPALRLRSAVRKSSHIISWFAGDHSFFAALWARSLGRKSLIILGGWDVARLPDIPYGAWCTNSRTQKYRLRSSISWPDEAWVVEESMIERVGRFGRVDRTFHVVPTILDSNVFKCTTNKIDQVAIVSVLGDYSRAMLKGIPEFIEIARRMPDVTFLVIGLTEEFLRRFWDLPPNIKATGFLSVRPLVELLSRTKVYCNLSLSEGLNNSLCEAMLCECVPVTTNIPGNLAAVGNNQGVEVLSANPHDIDSLVNLVKLGLKSDGSPYRDLIIRKFPPSKRIEAFQSFLTE